MLGAVRTVAMQLPKCVHVDDALRLLVNVQTSIGGHLSISLLHASTGVAVAGFGPSDAVPFVGNFIDVTAAWGEEPAPAPAPPAPLPHTTCTYELPGGLVCGTVLSVCSRQHFSPPREA